MLTRTGVATMALLAAGVVLAADARGAVPAALTHQGRLLTAAGQPVATSQIFIYKIYDAATAGNVLWTETLTVPLDQGYFSVSLGTTTAISDALLAGGPRFLGVQVGTDPEMTPRESLTSVPYARLAGDVSGDIHPTSVSVAGAPVINAAGKWVGAAPQTITDCMTVVGACGNGTYNQPTMFLDRVGGVCPAERPVLHGISFVRCGTLDTPNEGLAFSMSCCALK